MKFSNILIIFVLSFFCMSTVNAEIYIWTDENGIKHYSDHPPTDENKNEVRVETQTFSHNEAEDRKRTEKEQKELQGFIEEVDRNYEKEQQAERLKAKEAEKSRPPTEKEKIAAEKERLEKKIAELEEKPLEYFGSQKNKRIRIGFYRYRLQDLLQDPDNYFKNPQSFEGNIKEP